MTSHGHNHEKIFVLKDWESIELNIAKINPKKKNLLENSTSTVEKKKEIRNEKETQCVLKLLCFYVNSFLGFPPFFTRLSVVLLNETRELGDFFCFKMTPIKSFCKIS